MCSQGRRLADPLSAPPLKEGSRQVAVRGAEPGYRGGGRGGAEEEGEGGRSSTQGPPFGLLS